MKALQFDAVSKVYRKGAERANLRAALPGRWGRHSPKQGHWALRELSFEVDAGEILGIIGPNGAGKSTLLKLAARVIAPSRGRLAVQGRVSSLIELGVGFHPDLTGAENVRFSAAVLGMNRKDVACRYDEIVDFAGIEPFMTTPVKRYSSGMLARLGFAVAAHLDAEVMLVDEVLSVGDAEFQRRSYERMRALQQAGSTLLMVTHNLFVVPEVCQRALRLEAGRVADEGAPRDVVDRYVASATSRLPSEGTEAGGTAVRILETEVSPLAIRPGESVSVRLKFRVHQAVEDARATLVFAAPSGQHAAGTDLPGTAEMLLKPGTYEVQGRVAGVWLADGHYRAYFTIVQRLHELLLTLDQTACQVTVIDDGDAPQYGHAFLDAEWSMSPGA